MSEEKKSTPDIPFVRAGESDADAVNKIAINEERLVGFIVKVKSLNTVKIYVGFDLETGEEWVSMNPLILNCKINLHSVNDMMLCLKDSLRKSLKEKNKREIGIATTFPESSSTGGITWNKISFSDGPNNDPMGFEDFLKKILFPNPESSKTPNEIDFPDMPDFKFDNEDEDKDNP